MQCQKLIKFIKTACNQTATENLPCPLQNLQVTVNSTVLIIRWQMFEGTYRLEIVYSYSVKRCSAPIGAPQKDVIADNSITTHILSGLNEDSKYTISVRSINAVGSRTDILTADTSTAGEKEFLLSSY